MTKTTDYILDFLKECEKRGFSGGILNIPPEIHKALLKEVGDNPTGIDYKTIFKYPYEINYTMEPNSLALVGGRYHKFELKQTIIDEVKDKTEGEKTMMDYVVVCPKCKEPIATMEGDTPLNVILEFTCGNCNHKFKIDVKISLRDLP